MTNKRIKASKENVQQNFSTKNFKSLSWTVVISHMNLTLFYGLVDLT